MKRDHDGVAGATPTSDHQAGVGGRGWGCGGRGWCAGNAAAYGRGGLQRARAQRARAHGGGAQRVRAPAGPGLTAARASGGSEAPAGSGSVGERGGQLAEHVFPAWADVLRHLGHGRGQLAELFVDQGEDGAARRVRAEGDRQPRVEDRAVGALRAGEPPAERQPLVRDELEQARPRSLLRRGRSPPARSGSSRRATPRPRPGPWSCCRAPSRAAAARGRARPGRPAPEEPG